MRCRGMGQAEMASLAGLLGEFGDDQEAEAARPRALGATDIDLGQGDVPWRCMTDPDGHEFCVRSS